MLAAIEQCWIYRSAAPSSHFARNGVSLDFRVASLLKIQFACTSPPGSSPRWGAKNVLPLNLIALPCGAVYPPPSARPFFKGLLSCHVKAPLVKTTKREYPRIVISSGARNLPCTPVKQREWDDDKRNTLDNASDNDTKKRSSHITSPPPS